MGVPRSAKQKAFGFLFALVLLATVPMWWFHHDYGRYRAHQHAKCAPARAPRSSSQRTDTPEGDTWWAERATTHGNQRASEETDRSGVAARTDDDGRFTVLLNTFKRRDLLKLAVAHYATCPDVAQIRVVWSEQTPPPALEDGDGPEYFGPRPAMVVYDAHPTTSIQNRFEPQAGIVTSAVFNVDDDVRMPCVALSRG